MVEMKSLINQAIVRQCSAFHVPFSILSQEEEALSSLQEHNLIFLGRAE